MYLPSIHMHVEVPGSMPDVMGSSGYVSAGIPGGSITAQNL